MRNGKFLALWGAVFVVLALGCQPETDDDAVDDDAADDDADDDGEDDDTGDDDTADDDNAGDDDTADDDDAGDDDTADDDDAGLLYLDQQQVIPGATSPFDADCEVCPKGVETLADNFVVEDTLVILHATIWCAYQPNGIPLATDHWTVLFHEDEEGLPGAVVWSESDVASNRVMSGQQKHFDDYKVTLVFGTHPLLEAGTYWIEVFNDSTGSDQMVSWVQASPDSLGHGLPGSASDIDNLPGSEWHAETILQDYALQLYTK